MTTALLISAVGAVLVGVALGLLGGGGSILTVPLLLYAAKLEPSQAIATSLLVVGAAAAAGLVQHARRGLVEWKTGALFGGASMIGAYGGGRAAQYVPPALLLLGFAAVMIATAVAMLRKKEEGGARSAPPGATRRPLFKIMVDGLVVGVVTGMVGAGGGFLVVPALVMLGGLTMPQAIATSLLVITMKSFAGFAGHLDHVSIDWTLALVVTAAAIGGTVVGSAAGKRTSPSALRKGFAGFVLVMAFVLIGGQMESAFGDSGWYRAVFVDRWPWPVAGGAIGLFALAFLYFENKLLGVSTGLSEVATTTCLRDDANKSWRIPFIIGIVLGGAAASIVAGRAPTLSMGSLDTLVAGFGGGAGLGVEIALLLVGGALVGAGSRVAGGCTSGHAIVGVAQLAKSSLVATAMFLIGAFGATHFVRWLAGV